MRVSSITGRVLVLRKALRRPTGTKLPKGSVVRVEGRDGDKVVVAFNGGSALFRARDFYAACH